MNKVILAGIILSNSEKNTNMYVYKKGDGEKKSFLAMRLSVRKPFAKKTEEGYYPSEIFNAKAFGYTADFINQYFKQGDGITIIGSLDIEKGGEKEDSTRYPDRTVIIVENAEFPVVGRNQKQSASNSASAPAAQPAQPQQTFDPFSSPF